MAQAKKSTKRTTKTTKRTTTARKTTKRPAASRAASSRRSAREDFYPNRIPFLTVTLGVVVMMAITMIIYSSYK